MSEQENVHELRDHLDGPVPPEIEGFDAFPSADSGWRAWAFLFSCFMVEAMAWGFPYTFGLFENYYATHDLFEADRASIAIIGTTALGVMYLSPPVLSWVFKKRPGWRRTSCVFSVALIVIALVASSYANTVPQLIGTQGVLYGIGGGLLYYPMVLFLDEWFIRRKGFAFGVVCSAIGCSGVVIPYLMNFLLQNYGFRVALRVWAITVAVITMPVLYLLRPRIPVSSRTRLTDSEVSHVSPSASGRERSGELTLFSLPGFWILEAINVGMSLGFFMPAVFLPSFARSLHISADPRTTGTTSIALYNVATVAGAISAGALSDRMHVTYVMLFSAVGATVAALALWGFALSTALLYVFAIAYGFFGGGQSATWSACAGALRNRAEKRDGQGAGANVEMGMVVAYLCVSKGLGACVSGPLSSSLMTPLGTDKAAGAYGSEYGGIILFTGVTSFLGSLGWVSKIFGFI